MAKLKNENKASFLEHLHKISEDFDRNYPVLAERYLVEEYQRDWYDCGYYGQGWIKGKRTNCFIFSTIEEREKWLKDHEPQDKHHRFELRTQKLRRFYYEDWV